MYNEHLTRVPRDEDELWDIFEEQFSYIRSTLWETPVEERDEALNQTYYRAADGEVKLERGLQVIRYRARDPQMDQRDHFLEMGRKLLPYIEYAIDERQFTPEFVQQWGIINFCHGYIASYYFDDSDDLSHVRAGLKTAQLRSKDRHRKWLAHLITRLIENGKSRVEAEDLVLTHVQNVLATKRFPPHSDATWFKAFIGKNGLATTYDEKHFSLKQMRKLVQEPTDDIPPIPEIP